MTTQQIGNISAVHSFWEAAHRKTVNTVITVEANLVYSDTISGKVLFRSQNPVNVYIDTTRDNNFKIPDLPEDKMCFSEFSTHFQTMSYDNGVLTITGNGFNAKPPYKVILMAL